MEFDIGEKVSLIIERETDLGFSVLINGSYKGLLYENEIFEPVEKNMEILQNAALIDSELYFDEGFGSHTHFAYWKMLVESENRYGRDESHTSEFFNLLGIKTNCTDIVFDYSKYIE